MKYHLQAPLSFVCLTSLLLATGCQAGPPLDIESEFDESDGALRTKYESLDETLSEDDFTRWRAVRGALVAGFDKICGDTICSGDYQDLTTLELACSSTSSRRKMKDCVWLLGGSNAYVAGDSGTTFTEARVFECHVPVAKSVNAMLAALEAAGDNALFTPLPGTAGSFYDALTTCFANVRSAPPPAETAPILYLDLTEALWATSDHSALAWNGARRSLAKQFDDVCGDTFCEGEFSDIQALRLTCPVESATGRVKGCHYTFAGADSSMNRRGRFDARTMTTTCAFAVDAEAGELVSAVAASDSLHAVLPGSTSSIYDSLIGCL